MSLHLPRKICYTKVAVSGYRVVVNTLQAQLINDPPWCQVVVVTDKLLDHLRVLLLQSMFTETGCIRPMAYAICISHMSAYPDSTISLPIFLAMYAPLRSAFDLFITSNEKSDDTHRTIAFLVLEILFY